MHCELCGRIQPLTFHHLIPKAVHGKKRFREQFGKKEMQSRGIDICRLCHDGIHTIIPEEKELVKYNTRELLLAHPQIAKHVAWVRKQH